MLGRSRDHTVTADVKRSIWLFARQLQEDETLRERLLAALAAGFAAWQHLREVPRRKRTTAQLVADPVLRRELSEAVGHLEAAQKRVQGRRRHRLRNSLFVLVGAGVIAGAFKTAASARG